MSSPLTISVIVPAYNHATFLPEAIASVLAQTRPPAEIIVVDDGSTDGTYGVAKQLTGVRYVHQKNSGPAAARNRGIALATGNTLAFLDADDLWLPDKLEHQGALMQARPQTDVVLGLSRFLQLDGTCSADSLPGRPVPIPSFGSALVRRTSFDRIGPLDETLRYSEDVDWFMRAIEQGCALHLLPKVVQRCRRHGGNMTDGQSVAALNLFSVLKRSLDRRRRSSGQEEASDMVYSAFSRTAPAGNITPQ